MTNHPMINKGKQTNLDIITLKGKPDTVFYAQNTLNNNWMVWFKNNDSMLAFENKKQLNSFLKDIKQSCEVIKEYKS